MSTEVKQEYWLNGKLKWKTPYQNGKYHGVAKWWGRDGKLRYETPYQNGKLHGITKRWGKNGRPEYKAYYLYDKEVTQEEWHKHELIEKLSNI